jgi:hypothetical protein
MSYPDDPSQPSRYSPSAHEVPGAYAPPPYGQPPQWLGFPAPVPYWYGYAPQPPYPGSVTRTRPPFPHGRHIRWSIYSFGKYLWHRLGPTKCRVELLSAKPGVLHPRAVTTMRSRGPDSGFW